MEKRTAFPFKKDWMLPSPSAQVTRAEFWELLR